MAAIPEFIDRINNPQKYPVIWNEDGTYSTHEMAAEYDDDLGQWIVFPTIVQMPTGELHRFEDPMYAQKYNIRTGNYIPMATKKEALSYAKNGYKKGTPLNKFRPKR